MKLSPSLLFKNTFELLLKHVSFCIVKDFFKNNITPNKCPTYWLLILYNMTVNTNFFFGHYQIASVLEMFFFDLWVHTEWMEIEHWTCMQSEWCVNAECNYVWMVSLQNRCVQPDIFHLEVNGECHMNVLFGKPWVYSVIISK